MLSSNRLVVHSWDFDGMLADPEFIRMLRILIDTVGAERGLNRGDFKSLATSMLKAHKLFFDKRFKSVDKQSQHVVVVGSNRQFKDVDFNNCLKTKGLITLSCYPFFEALVIVLKLKYKIDITLDKVLLEDLHKRLPIGTTFDKVCNIIFKLPASFYKKLSSLFLYNDPGIDALHRTANDELQRAYEHDQDYLNNFCNQDRNKILTVYAQMLHINRQYANDGATPVEFNFCDDNVGILDALFRDFSKNKRLLPPNVSLQLAGYISEEMKKMILESRQGKGGDQVQTFDDTRPDAEALCAPEGATCISPAITPEVLVQAVIKYQHDTTTLTLIEQTIASIDNIHNRTLPAFRSIYKAIRTGETGPDFIKSYFLNVEDPHELPAAFVTNIFRHMHEKPDSRTTAAWTLAMHYRHNFAADNTELVRAIHACAYDRSIFTRRTNVDNTAENVNSFFAQPEAGTRRANIVNSLSCDGDDRSYRIPTNN